MFALLILVKSSIEQPTTEMGYIYELYSPHYNCNFLSLHPNKCTDPFIYDIVHKYNESLPKVEKEKIKSYAEDAKKDQSLLQTPSSNFSSSKILKPKDSHHENSHDLYLVRKIPLYFDISRINNGLKNTSELTKDVKCSIISYEKRMRAENNKKCNFSRNSYKFNEQSTDNHTVPLDIKHKDLEDVYNDFETTLSSFKR